MSNLEKFEINDLFQFIQNVFEIIKQTHSESEKEKSLFVLRKFLNIKENSDSNNSFESLSFEDAIRASCPIFGIQDPAVYELLQKGLTLGIHDLEIFNRLIMKIQPVDFSEIIAIWPLYLSKSFLLGIDEEYYKRKNGLVDYTYLHPSLRNVYCDTYGIFLYEEQIIESIKIITGLSEENAVELFKTLKNCNPTVYKNICKKFVEDAIKNGIEEDLAKKIFETLHSSTLYAVCKVKYAEIAVLVYKLAYLKSHYFVEFMAAYLNQRAKEYFKYIDLANKETNNTSSENSSEFQAKEYGYIDKEAFIYETKAFGYVFNIPEFLTKEKTFKTDGKTIWYVDITKVQSRQ